VPVCAHTQANRKVKGKQSLEVYIDRRKCLAGVEGEKEKGFVVANLTKLLLLVWIRAFLCSQVTQRKQAPELLSTDQTNGMKTWKMEGEQT
jgi:hypothetical protein